MFRRQRKDDDSRAKKKKGKIVHQIPDRDKENDIFNQTNQPMYVGTFLDYFKKPWKIGQIRCVGLEVFGLGSIPVVSGYMEVSFFPSSEA